MGINRRNLMMSLGNSIITTGVATVLVNCGGSEKANSNTVCVKNQLPSTTDMESIASYYKDNSASIDYISSVQGSGENYGTKVYVNTVTLGSTDTITTAGGDSSTTLGKIRGLYLDPADTGHTPQVSNVAVDSSGDVTITFSVNHTLEPATSSSHGITAFCFWGSGNISNGPLLTEKITESGEKNKEMSVTITSSQLGNSQFLYIIAHCNNHGGRFGFSGVSATT